MKSLVCLASSGGRKEGKEGGRREGGKEGRKARSRNKYCKRMLLMETLALSTEMQIAVLWGRNTMDCTGGQNPSLRLSPTLPRRQASSQENLDEGTFTDVHNVNL